MLEKIFGKSKKQKAKEAEENRKLLEEQEAAEKVPQWAFGMFDCEETGLLFLTLNLAHAQDPVTDTARLTTDALTRAFVEPPLFLALLCQTPPPFALLLCPPAVMAVAVVRRVGERTACSCCTFVDAAAVDSTETRQQPNISTKMRSTMIVN